MRHPAEPRALRTVGTPIARCARPCPTCPWRVDTVHRIAYPNLAEYAAGTIGAPGQEAPVGAPMFGCHAIELVPGWLCAAWLAIVGQFHLTVRFAVAVGALPAAALRPGRGWPELFPTYAAMEAAHRHAHTPTETP
ncbi:DUF6283 family protein [Actinomadura sp. WMMA1423]|uniref:DUF6283 family protein n=1 Tax=Actinomadura sp. WMMA1423 TaxID=2591108 RepID=UPI00197A9DA1|nr:DUF6283 family protein [Actinomadura sp. WMMA1423]